MYSTLFCLNPNVFIKILYFLFCIKSQIVQLCFQKWLSESHRCWLWLGGLGLDSELDSGGQKFECRLSFWKQTLYCLPGTEVLDSLIIQPASLAAAGRLCFWAGEEETLLIYQRKCRWTQKKSFKNVQRCMLQLGIWKLEQCVCTSFWTFPFTRCLEWLKWPKCKS